jgi:hypothetical protein
MAWVGTSGGGISGEMIRDMMLDCVERRFNALRAPPPVQWLADNGSAYTAGETTGFAVALNLAAIVIFWLGECGLSLELLDWPFAAAIATLLLGISRVVAVAYGRLIGNAEGT